MMLVVKYPEMTGHECAGTVVETGAEVREAVDFCRYNAAEAQQIYENLKSVLNAPKLKKLKNLKML